MTTGTPRYPQTEGIPATVPLPVFLADIGCVEHPGNHRLRSYASLLNKVGSRDRRYYWIAVAIAKAKAGRVPTTAEYTNWLTKRSDEGRAVQLLLEAGWTLPLADSDIEAAKETAHVAGMSHSKRFRWTARKVRQARAAGLGIPTAESIAQQWEHHNASREGQVDRYRLRRFDRLAPEMVALAKRDREAVQKFVKDIRRETGTGPTWREVRNAMNWPKGNERIEIAIRYLIGSGSLICEESVTRSLDVAQGRGATPT